MPIKRKSKLETLAIDSRNWVNRLFILAFNELTSEFLKVDLWRALSSSPHTFDEEVDKVLSKIKALVKRFYGIRSHRPVTKTERDANIVRLKTSNPSMTFGQIATKVGLDTRKANVVEAAFNRARDRERKDFKDFLETLADLDDLQTKISSGQHT